MTQSTTCETVEQLSVSNLNLNDLEKLHNEVKSKVSFLIRKFNPNYFLPIEDITQDCFTTLWSRGFFGKYDGSKSMFNTYLYNGVKNFLIDQERSASIRVKTLSFEYQVSDNMTLGDICDKEVSDEAISFEVYSEILKSISEKNKIKERKINIDGKEYLLNEYTIIYLKLQGYNFYEIADMFKVSGTYISRLYKDGKETIANTDIEKIKITKEKKIDCPHCKSKEIKYWSMSWTYIPLFSCNNCKKTFNLFTNTPLNGLREKDRDECICVLQQLYENKPIKNIAIDTCISMRKVAIWATKYWNYFEGEFIFIRKKRIEEWSKLIELAKKRKKENDWSIPKEPLILKNWIK